jgi:S-disulfanyl-L-cysteine oxidoreductase SoxD
MYKSSLGILLLLLASANFAAPPSSTAGKYGIGREPTAEEIAGWNISVHPDGRGLPPGSGSVAKGEKPYEQKCAVCHGSFGESNDYHVLSGGRGSLATQEPMSTVGSKWEYATTLFDYIRRAMPLNAPQSLTTDEVYSLTAYVLYLNDILKEDAVIDRHSLPLIKMPNADGFTTAHGLMSITGKPDTHNVACMKDCAIDIAIHSELPPEAKVALNSKPPAATAVVTPFKLAKEKGCTACHDLAHKVVGPAFREVATRYQSAADAEAKLAAKVKRGGSGNWGETAMPPQAQVTDAELKTLLSWILAGAKTP